MRYCAFRGCLIFSLVLVAISVGGVSWAEKAKRFASYQHHYGTADGNDPAEDPIYYAFPIATSSATHEYKSPQPKEERGEEQQAEEENGFIKWAKNLFYDLKITDILLTFFTGALAIYTYRLWISTEKLWTAGEIHAERELKAYITILPGWINNIDPNLRMQVGFGAINVGKTLANKAVQAAVLRIKQHPLPPNFIFPNLAGIARNSSNVISPNLQYSFMSIADQNFTTTQIIEILQAPAQGGRRLYIFGQIDYIDIFEKTRITRFCMSFQGRADLVQLAQQGNWGAIANAIVQPGSAWSFEFSNQHNEAT